MSGNKNKIMEIVSCLVVVGILMSAVLISIVPMNASDLSDSNTFSSSSCSKDWWTSEEGIANAAQLLNENRDGKGWQVHQKGIYILFLIGKGVKTEKIEKKYIDGTTHSMDVDIPEYYSFLFDKEKKEFITGKDAEDIVIEIYLDDYLEGAKEWGFVYSDHIRSTSDDLLSRAKNPLVTIGGAVAMQVCVSGKALATFLVTQNPNLAGKTYMNDQKAMIIEIGNTAFEKAEIEGSEWGKTGQDLIKGYKCIQGGRTILKQVRLVKIAKRLQEAGKLYEDGRCLTDVAFTDAANIVGESVFPTKAVTATAIYYSYSAEKAHAAEELANKAKSNWHNFKKAPTRDNYLDTFYTLMEAYHQLALGYEFQARAIERNRGGITGFFAEKIHDCLNRVDVQENINNYRSLSENMEDWMLLMYINALRPLYWTNSATMSLQYPDIDFFSVPKEAEIVSCAVDKYGNEVEAKVEVVNHKSITHTYTVGFSVRSPQGHIFDIPAKEVTLAPDESKKLSLFWEIPSNSVSGSYDATTALWEKDFSKNYDRWGWMSGQFIVDSVKAKITSCTFDSERYDYKDVVEASVDLKNDGEDQRFLLKMSLKDESGSLWGVSESYVHLNYGEELEVPHYWIIDENTPEGWYSATVELKCNGIVKDSMKRDNIFEVVLTNLPPKVYRGYPTTRYLPISEGSTLTFKINAEDRDGNLKLVRWLLNGEKLEDHTVTGSSCSDEYTYTFDKRGKFVITAQVFDEKDYFNFVVWDGIRIEEPRDITMKKGLEWLRDPDQQKTDGDYVYWTYKGTPNVGITALVTLAFLNHGYDESDPTVKGALNWLVAQANDADGSISRDDRKVYDTSLAILPLVAAQNEAKYGTVKANARKYLISMQNDEGTGYDHSDRFYGGWGYPRDNWADLSNTQFVVMALDAAGGLTGGVKDNALTFVTRCQNRKESNSEYSSYDDGGFVYQPKSGGTSYGSMTAAGLWGLFLCGVDKNDGRLTDALGWLDERSVEQNDPIGNKWVYYYDLGLAKAYLMAEARGCEFGKTNWYEDLYAFLSDKQDKKDGHWHNIEGENSCDVLATAEAILALSVKEVPERISRLSYIVFKLRSAADLHIYDPEGRHVGLNSETGEVEIEIPDATYTENPIEIKIPNLEAGGYKAVLIGTEAGEYELEVVAKTGNKTLAEASYGGWITEGATQEMITTISSIVGPLDVRLGSLKAIVEEEDSYSEHFSLDAGDELEIDAIDETGVLLRIEAEEDCEGEVKIIDYSENPTIKGFPGEYKYCALEKYVEISLDVDREKIDWPIYLEVHYDKDELPENVDESTLTIYHYLNDTKWRSCNDFEVNREENYISAELEKDELCYFGMGGLYAPIWVRYSMILIVIAIVIVLAVGYFSIRRFAKSRRVKAMKVPERVPAKVAITIYNFDNSFRILNEREETAKISDGLDGRLASGEIKEETYNDLKSKYESKIVDLNGKIKAELERAKAYLQRIEDEQTKLQRTHENLNAELQKEKGRKKKAEISAKVAEISAELERVDGIIKSMKEKSGVIEAEVSGD